MSESGTIKLVGLDMDGTLLGKDRILTGHTVDVMRRVADLGVNFVVDSGRRFEVVPQVIRELPFMRYFVLCNGAEIYDKFEDRDLYRAEIGLEDALRLYDDLTDCSEVYLDLYMDDGAWARAEDYARIDEFVTDQSHRDILHTTRTPVEDFRGDLIRRGRPIYKLQTIYKNQEIRDREKARMKALHPEFLYTEAYTYNLEINVPGATKGGGLMKLAELLGLEREQVIAFGDSSNDLSMLLAAGTGYAMGNATQAIKDAADKVAPPNTEDGVAKVLEELFLK